MNEVMVIFSLAAAGCLVRLSTDMAAQRLARKLPDSTITTVTGHRQSPQSRPKADPVFTVLLTLTCYGTLAIGIVTELPGAFANERTGLAFALLCVGGLIAEISRARAGHDDAEGESPADDVAELTPSSIGLSIGLMLTLNLAVALFCSGQDLVAIVPPAAPTESSQTAELEQIVVIGRRTSSDTPRTDATS